MNRESLLVDDPRKLFFHYLGSTILANMVHALYILVDVFCVGKGVGSIGLAAMNIALPVFTVFSSVALCVGVGGAATMSYLRGKGEEESTKKIFSLCSFILLIFGVLFAVFGTVFVEPISFMLGADEVVLKEVKTYLIPVLLTSFTYMYSHMFQTFLRNDNNPKLAMIAMLVGSILNIVGDYVFIFIFKWGIIGAALPTSISPLIACLIMSSHLFSKESGLHFRKNFFDFELLKRIVYNGLGTFTLEICAGISIVILNTVLLRDYGVMAVSLYTVMANISYLGKYIFNGIGQAAQPLISINEGANKKDRSYVIMSTALVCAVIFGGVFFAIIAVFPNFMLSLFTNEIELIEFGVPYMNSYFICLVFAGISTQLMYYYQSSNHPLLAIGCALSKSFLFFVLGIVIMPIFFELRGLYFTTAFSEIVTCLIFGVIFIYYKWRYNRVYKSI